MPPDSRYRRSQVDTVRYAVPSAKRPGYQANKQADKRTKDPHAARQHDQVAADGAIQGLSASYQHQCCADDGSQERASYSTSKASTHSHHSFPF